MHIDRFVLKIDPTLYYTGMPFKMSRLPWWRHQMKPFSALLALCAGNSPVTGEFPSRRPVTRSFDVFFDLRLNKRLSKQSWGWWIETPSNSLWRHCNGSKRIEYIPLNMHMVLLCFIWWRILFLCPCVTFVSVTTINLPTLPQLQLGHNGLITLGGRHVINHTF